MKTLVTLLIYLTATVSLLSLFYFIAWSISMPQLLIDGFESSGLPPLPEDYPWRTLITLKLVCGIWGWLSLFAIFFKQNKGIKDTSKIWLIGLVVGCIAAITMLGGFHSLSYPPIILAILLVIKLIMNTPNESMTNR